MRRFRGLDDGTRLIVAPEGLSRFYLDDGAREHVAGDPIGSTWMTREDRLHEIRDYISYLDAVLEEVTDAMSGPPEELVILGFSQGAQTACRWMVSGDMPVSRLVCWGAYPPHDLDQDRAPRRLAETDLVLVRGTSDPLISEAGHQRQEARLTNLGIQYRTIEHAGGHDIDADLLHQLAEGSA